MKALLIILMLATQLSYISFAQQSICDYKAELIVNGTEFEKENFRWRMKATKLEGASTNITGTAEILDSKGNIVKKYKPWTSETISRQKTSSEYSPNLKEGEEYKLKADINVECDDINKDNNADVRIIKIKFKNIDKQVTSSNVYYQETEIKNNKDIVTNVNTENKIITTINTTQIRNNETNQEQNETEEMASDEAYENVIQLTAKKDQKNQLSKSTADVVQEQIVYESTNEKAKKLIILFLLALSILLNVVLIWKR